MFHFEHVDNIIRHWSIDENVIGDCVICDSDYRDRYLSMSSQMGVSMWSTLLPEYVVIIIEVGI